MSFDKDISYVLMLSAIAVAWLFPKWDDISKPTLLMFLISKETEGTSSDLVIIFLNLSKHFSRIFCDIYDLNLILLILFCKFITFSVRPEKFQFMEKGQNRNFHYKIVITVKNP